MKILPSSFLSWSDTLMYDYDDIPNAKDCL